MNLRLFVFLSNGISNALFLQMHAQLILQLEKELHWKRPNQSLLIDANRKGAAYRSIPTRKLSIVQYRLGQKKSPDHMLEK